MGVSALSRQHKSFLDKKCLLPMAQFYGITEENLNAEMHQVRRLLEKKTKQGNSFKNTELLLLMEPYKDAFMDLHKLILISLTLPVTSVSCERSFSCLRRLKTYLRSNCGDDQNSNLAILAINTRRAKALDVQRIIDVFSVNHNNRRIVIIVTNMVNTDSPMIWVLLDGIMLPLTESLKCCAKNVNMQKSLRIFETVTK